MTKQVEKQQNEREKLKGQFLEYFRECPIKKYAAASIGRSEDTIANWEKEDADFSVCIDRVRADFLKKNLKLVRSKEWILERMFKDYFSQRTDVTGAEGQPLVIIRDASDKSE